MVGPLGCRPRPPCPLPLLPFLVPCCGHSCCYLVADSGPGERTQRHGEETPDRLAPFVGEDTIGRKAEIWLPSTWSVFVANGSLKLLHYVGDEAVFTARLPDESQSDVVLLKKVEDGERAVREAKISQRLTAFASLGYSAGRGHIVSRFDVQTHPEGTFVLSEPITYGLEGTPTLAQVLRKRHETFVQGLPLNPYSDAGRPMSLAQASARVRLLHDRFSDITCAVGWSLECRLPSRHFAFANKWSPQESSRKNQKTNSQHSSQVQPESAVLRRSLECVFRASLSSSGEGSMPCP